MRTTIIVVIAVIIAGVALFMLFGGSTGDSSKNRAGNTDKVPEFSLKDYNDNEVTLSDFEGVPLVINSWAVWCPFCREELADFAALQEEFGDEIVVIAIDRAESLEKAKGFTDEIGVTGRMTFLMDPRDSFYKSIGGFSMPETIFVDKEGNIKVHKRGPMDLSEMREKTLSILKQDI